MKTKTPAKWRTLSGTQLACPVCKRDEFTGREIKLESPVAVFFGTEIFSPHAQVLDCSGCGHILIFRIGDGGDAFVVPQ